MFSKLGFPPNCLPGQSLRGRGRPRTTPHAAVKNRPGSLQLLFSGVGVRRGGVSRPMTSDQMSPAPGCSPLLPSLDSWEDCSGAEPQTLPSALLPTHLLASIRGPITRKLVTTKIPCPDTHHPMPRFCLALPDDETTNPLHFPERNGICSDSGLLAAHLREGAGCQAPPHSSQWEPCTSHPPERA